MPAPTFKTIEASPVATDGNIHFVREVFETGPGRSASRVYVRHPGAAVIIPVAADGRMLVIHQYRHAVGSWLYELAAGTIEPGEMPLDCARREIVEECGVTAEAWLEIGELVAAPGFCDERQTVYVARELQAADAARDEDERIETMSVEVDTFAGWIAEGKLVDAKSIAAFSLARLKGALS